MSSVFGDFFTLQRGNTYKSALLGQPGPVLLGLGSIQRNGGFKDEKLKTYGGHSDPRMLLVPGDIYVSLKDVTQSADLLGAVARVPDGIEQGRVTQDTVKLVFEDGAPKDYLYWLMRTPQYRAFCRSHATGTTNLGLPRDDFLSFSVPELTPDREKLVETIQMLEDKIELNRRMNETLEEMARALFRDWFVTFGPTRRQMEGETDPATIMGHAFPPEKAATLAPLFPAKFGDDGLPEGWEMETLGDFAERSGGSIQTGPFGSQLHKSDYVESGVPVLMPANLTYSQIKSDGIAYITEEKANSLTKHRCKPGDIIYGRRGDIGRKALISDAQSGWFCGTGCLKVSIHSTERSPNVLVMQLDTEDAVRWIRSRAIGATMPNLNTKTLGGLPILKIGPELSAPFTEIAGPLEDKRQQNEQANQTLAEMRDLLLPKLMSGEIRLKDVEAAL